MRAACQMKIHKVQNRVLALVFSARRGPGSAAHTNTFSDVSCRSLKKISNQNRVRLARKKLTKNINYSILSDKERKREKHQIQNFT